VGFGNNIHNAAFKEGSPNAYEWRGDVRNWGNLASWKIQISSGCREEFGGITNASFGTQFDAAWKFGFDHGEKWWFQFNSTPKDTVHTEHEQTSVLCTNCTIPFESFLVTFFGKQQRRREARVG
jgi:hypothetical protein